jgi:hypothetical protein
LAAWIVEEMMQTQSNQNHGCKNTYKGQTLKTLSLCEVDHIALLFCNEKPSIPWAVIFNAIGRTLLPIIQLGVN